MRSEMYHRGQAVKEAKKSGGIKKMKYNLNESIGTYVYKDKTGYHIEPTYKTKK